jgi:hypothetical protein
VFGHGVNPAGGHDHVIEHANIDQLQRSGEGLSQVDIS